LEVEIQFALRRDGADGREMVAGPPLPQDGSLANGCIGGARHWARESILMRLRADGRFAHAERFGNLAP
jgi:hypothetical protein